MSERGPEGIKITMDKLANSAGNEGVRKGELSAYAEKKNAVSQPLDEKGYLGPDYDKFLRRLVVDVTIGLIDLDKNRAGHEGEVDSASESLVRSKFGVGSVSEFKDRIDAQNYNSGAVTRSYERLTKSVKLFLNKKGFSDEALSTMSPQEIDAQLFRNFEGIGSDVKRVLVVDGQLKTVLKKVDNVLNRVEILDQGRKKKMDLKTIDKAMDKAEEILVGKAMGDDALKRQSELVIDYLTILKREVDQGKGDAEVEDCIVGFIGEHILRKGLTLDDEGNLKSTNGDDFTLLKDEEGRTRYYDNGEKMYIHPEIVRWMKKRNENIEDLIMITSNGEFSDIREIDAVLNNENEFILDDYIRNKYVEGNDLGRGKKADLLVIKDQLGRWFCDAIRDSGDETNRTVLGTLNAYKIENLLPMGATGLGVDIVINVSNDVLIRKALKQVCAIDMKKGSLGERENIDGFSSIETKKNSMGEIKRIIEKITGDNKRYLEGDNNYRTEVDGLVRLLNERVVKYDRLIAHQEKVGRYGEQIPTEPERVGERLLYARKLLDYVEDSGSPPGSLNIMDQCTRLFEMSRLDSVEQEIKDEIHARLHLAFMFYHMHAAGGLLNNRGQSIEDAHEKGYADGMLLDKITMDFLLKNGANGLPVAECWDAIEELNFGWENGKPVKDNDSYFRLLSLMVGIDYTKIQYENGDREGKISWENSKDASLPITVDNTEGKFLISMKENGLKFLGVKGELTDEAYLAKWNEIANPYEVKEEQITYRQKFVGDFYKLQNPESFFWGKGAENAMRFNYFTDISSGRKGMVKDFLLTDIKEKREAKNIGKSETEKLPTDKKSLEKGFELAEKLLEATAETSVFNPCFAGHNDFSELILTEANTKDRQKKMKVIGMRVAMADIVSFYTTWPRYIAGNKDSDRRSVFKPLYAEQIKTERMDNPKNDSYFLMTAILIKKILPVQAFLMKEDIGSKDLLTVEFWKKLYDPISKVISYGQDVLTDPDDDFKTIKVTDKNKKDLSRRLRLLVARAVFQSAISPTSDFDWGGLNLLGDTLTTKFTTVDNISEKDEEESFIEREDRSSLINDSGLKEAMEVKHQILLNASKEKERDQIGRGRK